MYLGFTVLSILVWGVDTDLGWLIQPVGYEGFAEHELVVSSRCLEVAAADVLCVFNTQEDSLPHCHCGKKLEMKTSGEDSRPVWDAQLLQLLQGLSKYFRRKSISLQGNK